MLGLGLQCFADKHSKCTITASRRQSTSMSPSPSVTGLQRLSRVACAAFLQQHLLHVSHLTPSSARSACAAVLQAWRQCSSQQHPHDHHHMHDQHGEEYNQQLVDKQQLLKEILRRTHAAEAAMAQVLAGQQLVLRNRPDAAFFADQEKQALVNVQQLLPRYRVRPSALLSVLQGAGLAAGTAAALSPIGTRNAVIGALQETLTELYNNQLRLLREAGLSDETPDVRAVLVKLRNLERAADGAPAPPDMMSLSLQKDALTTVGVSGVIGALVKAVADAAVAASGKV